MHVAGQHVRYPQRRAVGSEDRLDVAAEVVGLPRVPQVDLLPLLVQSFDADADGLLVGGQQPGSFVTRVIFLARPLLAGAPRLLWDLGDAQRVAP
jgi:hypothetical protein